MSFRDIPILDLDEDILLESRLAPATEAVVQHDEPPKIVVTMERPETPVAHVPFC